jgi:WD40 repeat protein
VAKPHCFKNRLAGPCYLHIYYCNYYYGFGNLQAIRVICQQKLATTMNELVQVTLNPPPTDIPSTLVFHPYTATSLLVSSWDSTLRYYAISADPSAQSISQYNQSSPILDCRFSNDGKNAVTASVNGQVNWYDVAYGFERMYLMT